MIIRPQRCICASTLQSILLIQYLMSEIHSRRPFCIRDHDRERAKKLRNWIDYISAIWDASSEQWTQANRIKYIDIDTSPSILFPFHHSTWLQSTEWKWKYTERITNHEHSERAFNVPLFSVQSVQFSMWHMPWHGERKTESKTNCLQSKIDIP